MYIVKMYHLVGSESSIEKKQHFDLGGLKQCFLKILKCWTIHYQNKFNKLKKQKGSQFDCSA